jgi:prostaglandin-H2 D-isomerase / glutathione transferase
LGRCAGFGHRIHGRKAIKKPQFLVKENAMHLRLTYFNFPFWRAETSRLALHLGGIEFEDRRVSGKEFVEMKNTALLPYGQLPVLEVDGVVFAQSVAIAKFCGKISGFYPVDDDTAALKVDEFLDTASQLTNLVGPSMREKDPENRAALRQKLGSEILPQWLHMLEHRMGEGDVLVGESLTVADFAIWRILGWLTGGILDGIPTDLLKPHVKLSAFFHHMEQNEKIKVWMQNHYPTESF